MALCPGLTRTEFFEVADLGGRWAWLIDRLSMRCELVVDRGLQKLGRRRTVVPSWYYSIPPLLARILPRKLVTRLAYAVLRHV
jgi:short-subunit dehydrogenase